MAGREVREYTNLTDPKDKKWGRGKDKIDDEDITFQRMVAKMQELAGECGGYLHGRGALDSDDLLYLKEQMEAEDDAERLLRRTEKRAFAAFKISSLSPFNIIFFICLPCLPTFALSHCNIMFDTLLVLLSLINRQKAAKLSDSSPALVPLSLRVEPKPKSGIRQQDLLKKVVEVKPKRQKVSSSSCGNQCSPASSNSDSSKLKPESKVEEHAPLDQSRPNNSTDAGEVVNPVQSLLGLAYENSDEEDE
ncbi:hypothetical protein RJ641_007370 [Dillenia turbinata]|uniref:Uncharacterized protein n=1 Tax=Dillenia turbinata TaxID=194707 RepID=A0AAN8Z5J3_9MAGN